MKFLTNVAVGAVLAVSLAGVAQAQSEHFKGSTEGCFTTGSHCNTGNSDDIDHIVSFSRGSFTGNTNSSGIFAISGNGDDNLGKITLHEDEDCIWIFLCSDGTTNVDGENFFLKVAFSDPNLNGSDNVFFSADLAGTVRGDDGHVTFDFDNTPQAFTVGSTAYTFTVNDLTIDLDGKKDSEYLSGTISRYYATTTPEPGSLALLGTGLVGLVPMVRRRRK